MTDQPRKERIISPEDKQTIKAIAAKAKRLRVEQGHSYEGFAINNNIHRITYYKFETGEQNFTASVLIKVIRGLGMSLSEFFKDL